MRYFAYYSFPGVLLALYFCGNQLKMEEQNIQRRNKFLSANRWTGLILLVVGGVLLLRQFGYPLARLAHQLGNDTDSCGTRNWH